MAIRRVNSTGRKKILRDDVKVSVLGRSDGTLEFDAAFNFVDYELPPDARVYLEAYRQSTFMRFDYGTVQSPQLAAGKSRKLNEFTSKDGLLFRVKVTSPADQAGLLLAEADQIPIESADNQDESRIPLLPTAPEDLGQEVWCVGIGASGPILQINKHLQDWKEVAGSLAFRCLVFPSAMRHILTHIVLIDQEPDADDQQSWRGRWLRFATSLGVGDPPDLTSDEIEKMEWIDAAVRRFSQHFQLVNHYKNHLTLEVSS